MTTRAQYTLVPMQDRTAAYTGPTFRTGRRGKWVMEIRCALVGTTFDVVLQASGEGTADSDFRDVHRETITATGVSLIGSGHETDFTGSAPDESDLWLRAVIENVTGDYAVEVLARAPFFDPSQESDDLELVHKQLRGWDDGRVAMIEKAESDVLSRIGGMRSDGTIPHLDLHSPSSLQLIKDAIAEQAEHRYQRHQLRQSRESSALVTLREMSDIAESAREILNPIVSSDRRDLIIRHR